MSSERLVHHELCFGCGRTNLFGLLMEVQAIGEGHVRARGFVKQDHQGPVPGAAHPGVVAAALTEAMAFASGPGMEATALDVRLVAPVAVGTFIEVEAHATDGGAEASARVDGLEAATARGAYRRR